MNIVGQRADGYHELQTLFQLIDLCDTLTFTLRQDGQLVLRDDLDDIASEDNLVMRAARLLQDTTGCPLGATLAIEEKHCPWEVAWEAVAQTPPPPWSALTSCGNSAFLLISLPSWV
ncbi:hypothetical protein [Vreelandella azerica]|uniref:hypothetical protein n=1 Tax=Vreelandella azerica TaxID=2732867 RepID=UPI001F47B1D7|nr:hypothetical protein [Halomonas azerica]